MKILLSIALILSACSSDDGSSYPTPCTDFDPIRGGSAKDTCIKVVAPSNATVRIRGDHTRGTAFVEVAPGQSWELVSCFNNDQVAPVVFEDCD